MLKLLLQISSVNYLNLGNSPKPIYVSFFPEYKSNKEKN